MSDPSIIARFSTISKKHFYPVFLERSFRLTKHPYDIDIKQALANGLLVITIAARHLPTKDSINEILKQ